MLWHLLATLPKAMSPPVLRRSGRRVGVKIATRPHSPACFCGCEQMTRGGRFLPSHDSHLLSAMLAEVGGIAGLRPIVADRSYPQDVAIMCNAHRGTGQRSNGFSACCDPVKRQISFERRARWGSQRYRSPPLFPGKSKSDKSSSSGSSRGSSSGILFALGHVSPRFAREGRRSIRQRRCRCGE